MFFIASIAKADQRNYGANPSYLVSGEAQLLSHFIDRGLSFSNDNPAMNASFLFNLGSQLKLGFWGSNISNVSAIDDNFWFKALGEIAIEFSDKFKSRFYISDDHFYKSDIRNGQIAGLDIDYHSYLFKLEWDSNFEGTKTNAEYFNFGRFFVFKKDFKYGGYIGYTNSHASTLSSYFDIRPELQYSVSTNSNAELGASFNSNGSQFGSRGDPAYYVGFKLRY